MMESKKKSPPERALKRGGADAPSNMQWQMIRESKAKDKIER
jgi:hypothetical protein